MGVSYQPKVKSICVPQCSWLSVVFFLLTINVYTQGIHHYPGQLYSVDNGLSQTSVYHIIQDSSGYIWAGTGDGLNRISPQGISFFKSNLNDSTGLSGRAIRGLLESNKGRIWIGTEGGLNFYSGESQSIQRSIGKQKLPEGCVIPIGFYNQLLICMKDWKSFFALDMESGEIVKRYPIDDLLSAGQNACVISGNILFGVTNAGTVLSLNLETGKSTSCWKNSTSGISPKVIGQLPDHSLLVSADKDLYLIDPEDCTWQLYFSAPANIQKIALINQNEIWMATAGTGIIRTDIAGKVIEGPVRQLQRIGNSTIDLSTVYEISQTPDGTVWLGIEGVGALMLQPDSPFLTITKNDPYFPGIKHPFFTDVTALKNNKLLARTYPEDLLLMDLSKKKATPIQLPPEIGNSIYAIQGWNEGALISCEHGLWAIQDLDFKDNPKPEQMLAERITFINRTVDAFYLAGPDGVYVWRSPESLPVKVSNSQLQCLVSGDGNTFYAVDQQWIKTYDHSFNLISEKDFSRYRVKSLMYDKGVGLWAATENGIFHLHEQTFEILKHFSTENGLPDNFVYGLLAYGETIWGSTNRGLFRLNLVTNETVSFFNQDGLQSNEFNSRAFAVTSDGHFIFGGINGVTIFNPADFDKVPAPRGPVLHSVYVNDKEISAAASEMVFNHRDRHFRFIFDFPDWIQYRNSYVSYKLKGFDAEWNRLPAHNAVQFSTLPPGKYELWARTVSGFGMESEAILFASFSVLPPFYQRWWFIGSSIVSVLLLFGLFIYYWANAKYRRQLKVLKRQKEIDDLRKRISRDIHDDVGADLAKLRLYLSQLERNDDQASTVLQKVKSLSQRAIEGLSEIVWTVNTEYDQLPEMLAWFRNYASEFLEDAGVTLYFESAEVDVNQLVDPELRRHLLMIYKEALNNIVKHSGASEVVIKLDYSEQHLRLLIQDNGKGFSTENILVGNGLKNMQHRAHLIKWSFRAGSDNQKGTTIWLYGRIS